MAKAKSLKSLYNTEKSAKMNPNETRGNNMAEPGEEKTCPTCGMEQKDWKGKGGKGFAEGEDMFCCQGCAQGSGCTCQDSSEDTKGDDL